MTYGIFANDNCCAKVSALNIHATSSLPAARTVDSIASVGNGAGSKGSEMVNTSHPQLSPRIWFAAAMGGRGPAVRSVAASSIGNAVLTIDPGGGPAM